MQANDFEGIICGSLQKASVLHVSGSSFPYFKFPRWIEIREHLEEPLLGSLQKGISFWGPWVACVWELLLFGSRFKSAA